jgi:lipoyl(octanoyl) transferase
MSYLIKPLGMVDYQTTWDDMKRFTENRSLDTPDEYWVLQHNPVFTLGLAGLPEHMLFKEHNIPTIRVDRGGQVTYHGPGQIVIYTLIDLKRNQLSIRDLVERLEQGIINYLATHGITANGDRCAPGVYIDGKKIASIGLKVRKNCTYHGISFNANMDTTPFNYINVCGYSGLKVVQLRDFINIDNFDDTALSLAQQITNSVYG